MSVRKRVYRLKKPFFSTVAKLLNLRSIIEKLFDYLKKNKKKRGEKGKSGKIT